MPFRKVEIEFIVSITYNYTKPSQRISNRWLEKIAKSELSSSDSRILNIVAANMRVGTSTLGVDDIS